MNLPSPKIFLGGKHLEKLNWRPERQQFSINQEVKGPVCSQMTFSGLSILSYCHPTVSVQLTMFSHAPTFSFTYKPCAPPPPTFGSHQKAPAHFPFHS